MAHACTEHGQGLHAIDVAPAVHVRVANWRLLGFIAGPTPRRRIQMYTIAVVLLIAWLLGIVGTYTMGGLVHVLLVVAVVLFLVGALGGRRTMA
jgi:hypothetical protein